MDWKKHTYEVLIREAHLDTFQHMNNAQYLSLLEEARWEILEKGGHGLAHCHAIQQTPIVLGVDISFLKEIKLRQKVLIESQILEFRSKVGILEQIFTVPSGAVHTRALVKMGYFDMKTRKLISPSTEFLRAWC